MIIPYQNTFRTQVNIKYKVEIDTSMNNKHHKKRFFILMFSMFTIGFVLTNAQNKIILTNNYLVERIDEAFVIKRNGLLAVEQGKLPALMDKNGAWVISQADDLNSDGNWDELAFVYSLKPKQTVQLAIIWVEPKDYPQFYPRTNARFGKMTPPGKIDILKTDEHGKYKLFRGQNYPYQTDGPAWENDKMGFRHYFDGRNVRDTFGKRTSKMVMDSVGIRSDGNPGDTYHVMHWWGRDIMSGARSFGLGGIAIQMNDSLVRLGVPIEETTDNVDQTRYTLVVKGPVRSIFNLDFFGWDVFGSKIDVHEKVTIWAGKYGYQNVITTSKLPKEATIVTGIVNNFNNAPYTQEKVGKYYTMSTFDKQTYDKVWYLGMSILIDQENWTGKLYEAPKIGNGITTTWCTNLLPNAKGEYIFYCAAAWELTDNRFTDKTFYLNTIRSYAKELSFQIKPILK